MKLDDFYNSGFLDYFLHLYCYFHKLSAEVSSTLLLYMFRKHILYENLLNEPKLILLFADS